jgi:hypothetical protein
MIVTTVWNLTGFHRIVELLKGMKLNADFYIAHRIDPFVSYFHIVKNASRTNSMPSRMTTFDRREGARKRVRDLFEWDECG